MKQMTWRNGHLLISNGQSCSIITNEDDESRNFATEGLSCLSPDGSLIAINEMNGVRVRRVVASASEWRPGDVLFTCQNLPSEPVLNFAWSADLLAVQLADGSTFTYQVASGKGRTSRPGEQKAIYRLGTSLERAQAMAFAPTMKRIALAQATRGVMLWEANSGKLVRNVESPGVLCVAWSPDERFFALGCIDSSVMIYIARSGKLHYRLTGHTAAVSALTWLPDSQRLVSGDRDGNILQWKTTEKGGLIDSIKPSMKGRIEAIAWSPEEEIAVVDSQDKVDFFPLR